MIRSERGFAILPVTKSFSMSITTRAFIGSSLRLRRPAGPGKIDPGPARAVMTGDKTAV